jgi:hypothetical protein
MTAHRLPDGGHGDVRGASILSESRHGQQYRIAMMR